MNPEWGADRPIRGVLFDMDGVILDSEKLFTRFWMEAAQQLGYPLTLEKALGMRSLNRDAGQRKLEEYFGPGVSYVQIRNLRVKLMDAWIAEHGVELKSGVREVLEGLRQRNIPAAITSSSPMDTIQKHLGEHGLLDQFRQLCSGYDVPRGKPDPDIYLLGAASLELPPENCLAVEDSPTGAMAAWRAGCLPLLVPDLDDPSEGIRSLLYARIDSLEDILGIIDSRKENMEK